MWRACEWPHFTFPVAVVRNLFAAPRWVFNFGITNSFQKLERTARTYSNGIREEFLSTKDTKEHEESKTKFCFSFVNFVDVVFFLNSTIAPFRLRSTVES